MHRLRDLDRRQRLVAAVLVALVMVPFGVTIAQAVRIGWVPSGDDALIGLRALDVFSRHRPLTGQPSTSFLYGSSTGTDHPGPIEFYVLSVPMRLLGPAVGMLAVATMVNVASILVAAWVVLRRAGPAVAAWSLVGLGGVLWSEGTAVLSDPISSNVGGLALLALAVLAWAVADGDLRLAPLAALFGSWVAQQHLAVVVPAMSMIALALAGLAVTVIVQRGRKGTGRRALPERGPLLAPRWPWLAAALAVAAVAWLPVVWQQATGQPGNISAVIDYARTSQRPKLGLGAGVRTAARALGWPPLLVRSDLSGLDFVRAPLGWVEGAVAVLTYLLLGATAVLGRHRRRRLALLAATAMVLAVAGMYNTNTIPAGLEVDRINFYRWSFVVAWLAWTVVGWLAVRATERWALHQRTPAFEKIGRVGLGVAIAALAVAAAASVFTSGFDDLRRDQAGFGPIGHLSDAAVAEAEGKGRVTLVLRGRAAPFSTGSALTLQLEAAGHRVVLPGVRPQYYGAQRVLGPGDDPGELILELVTGRVRVPKGPGRTIARSAVDEELNEIIRPLAEQASGAPVVRAPEAEELLVRRWAEPRDRREARDRLAQLPLDPYAVLGDPELVDILRDGYLLSPRFDDPALAAAAGAGPADTIWGDDVFELRVLTRAELAQEVPSWAEG